LDPEDPGLSFESCSNEGTVASSPVEYGSSSCGFSCMMLGNVSIDNCLNNGTIAGGNYSFGFTNVVTTANNNLCATSVTGTEHYQLWEMCDDACSNSFVSVEDNTGASVIVYNTTDGLHYVSIENETHLANELLTDEALSQGYTLKWTPTLTLGHVVHFTQLLNERVVVDHGTTLGTIPLLAPFLLDSNDYGLFNAEDIGQRFGPSTAVLCDMNIVVKSPAKPLVRVIIEITPSTSSGGGDDDMSILRLLANVTNTDIIGVEVQRDSDNRIIGIVVLVESDEAGSVVVAVVDGLNKGAGCDAGVLCRATKVYVDPDGHSLSSSGLVSPRGAQWCLLHALAAASALVLSARY
jgi:hypothetical protein